MKPLAALSSLTALYVDGEPAQRLLIGQLLGGHFRRVLLADGAAEGLRLFRAHPVHLVVTDLQMSGLSGLDLIARLRLQDRDLPILVMSASIATADLLAAVRLRLVDYLVKPVGPVRLREALELAALYGERGRGGEDSLKGLILRLRCKLGTGAIENRYGMGYRLASPERVPGTDGAGAAPGSAPEPRGV